MPEKEINMMYQEKFIAVVKCNNKILREQNKCEVHLPFGSEYSLLFKNLDSRRVNVNVSIDGTDILFGRSLVIDANSEMELAIYNPKGSDQIISLSLNENHLIKDYFN